MHVVPFLCVQLKVTCLVLPMQDFSAVCFFHLFPSSLCCFVLCLLLFMHFEHLIRWILRNIHFLIINIIIWKNILNFFLSVVMHTSGNNECPLCLPSQIDKPKRNYLFCSCSILFQNNPNHISLDSPGSTEQARRFFQNEVVYQIFFTLKKSPHTHKAGRPLQGVGYNYLFQRLLPPTPRAETGLPL